MYLNKNVYAFIDSQNLNLGIRSLGWKLDFKRFRVYLKDKYNVEKAFIFIGYVENNKGLYESLKEFGYDLVFKPTVRYLRNGRYVCKGNVDIELAIKVILEKDNFDKAIIVSADGDFYTLIKYLKENGKLLKVLIPSDKYSSLLKEFSTDMILMKYLEELLSEK